MRQFHSPHSRARPSDRKISSRVFAGTLVGLCLLILDGVICAVELLDSPPWMCCRIPVTVLWSLAQQAELVKS